jgi:predicted nucleic acid-binding protein
MNPGRVVIDTDIILDHLTIGRPTRDAGPSVMRKAMSEFFCYTTVFNVIELFELCETSGQKLAAESALGALKILGLNGKSGRSLGDAFRSARRKGLRDFDTLIAGLCVESRLPLLTGRPKSYRGVRSLRLIPAKPGVVVAKSELFGA